MSDILNSKLSSQAAVTDFNTFNTLRRQARDDDPEALRQVAKQFEGMFLNMMMSSMREANQLFSEDNPFNSQNVKFYQNMLDQQLSMNLTQGKGIGFADALVQQLSSQSDKMPMERARVLGREKPAE